MAKILEGTDKTILYLGLYKTMMVWLRFKKKENNSDILWLALKHYALRNQLGKYEYRIA
jgi:hypothetical protein